MSLANLLRLAKDGPKGPPPKNGQRSGSTREEIELAIKEYEKTKSSDAFEAVIDLARDYEREE